MVKSGTPLGRHRVHHDDFRTWHSPVILQITTHGNPDKAIIGSIFLERFFFDKKSEKTKNKQIGLVSILMKNETFFGFCN